MKRQTLFTLIELLVVIAIIAILASMLLPALKNARESANKIACLNQMKQFATANHEYVDDNSGYFPVYEPGTAGKIYDFQLSPYVNYNWAERFQKPGFSIWHCPSSQYNSTLCSNQYRARGYALNRKINLFESPSTARPVTVKQPSKTMLMHEVFVGTQYLTTYGPAEAAVGGGYTNIGVFALPSGSNARYLAFRHGNFMNLLFADGHANAAEKKLIGGYWIPTGGILWENGGTEY